MSYTVLIALVACQPRDTGSPKSTDTAGESAAPDSDTGPVDTGNSAETGDTSDSGETDSGLDTAPPLCDRTLGWRYVACGIAQSCGIHTDGCAECWGRGEAEAEADWETGGAYKWNGEDIPPEGEFASISMISKTYEYKETRFACGILVDGSAVCWGTDSVVDMSVVPDGSYVAVAAWEYGAYGILSDATAVGWGYVDPPPDGQFAMIATGDRNALYLRTDGSLLQTALSSPDEQAAPGGNYIDIGIGDTYACAISSESRILCWDPDDPDNAEVESLTIEAPVGSFVDVCNTGGGTACVLDDASTITCWGYSDPIHEAPSGEVFTQLACGAAHACGLTLDERIVCWGYDVAGETVPPS